MYSTDIRKTSKESISSIMKLTTFSGLPRDLKKRFLFDLLSTGETEKAQELSAVSQDLRKTYQKIPSEHIRLIRDIKIGNINPNRYVYHREALVSDYARFFLAQYDAFAKKPHSLLTLEAIANDERHEHGVFAKRKLAQISMTSLNDEERANAIGILSKLPIKSDSVVNALVTASCDDDYLVKWLALTALQKLAFKNDVVVNALIKALEDTSSEIKVTAVKALTAIDRKTEDVIEALTKTASFDPDAYIQVMTIKLLGKSFNNPSDVAKMFQSIKRRRRTHQGRQTFFNGLAVT